MTGTTTLGFAAVVNDYRLAGWLGVLPLPKGQKFPPPTGFTGTFGKTPDDEQISEWIDANPNGNVALHLADGVIGIDVDDYGDKTGGQTLAHAERLWGALPETFRSSAREGISGIYFFRVPEGTKLPGKLEIGDSSDVEIIQVSHRYAVVYPSVHPKTGSLYRWYSSDNAETVIPSVSWLPELPAAWLAGLQGQDGMIMGAGREKVRTSAQTAADVLANLPEGEMCPVVSERLSVALESMEDPGNRHDAALLHTMALVGMGHDGHAGVLTALTEFGEDFIARVSADRPDAEGEYDRMLQGAVERLRGNPITDDPCSAEEEESEEDEFETEVKKEVRRIRIKEEARIRAHAEMYGELEVPSLLTPAELEEFAGETTDWLIEGLIPRDGMSILAAEKKAGKTTLIQQMVKSISSGEKFLDTFATSKPDGNIVIFDLELPRQKLGEWTLRNGIANVNGVRVASLYGHVWDMNAADKNHRARMVEMLKAANCKMLIIDPVGPYLRMLGADENDATATGSAIDALTSLKVEAGIDTLVLTLHAGHGDKTRARGSSVLMDIPDVNMSLRKKDTDSPVRLFSASGRDVETETIAFQYDIETGSLDLVDGDEQLAQDRQDDVDHILEIVDEAPGISKNKIAQAMKIRVLGCGEKRAMAALKDAVSRSLVAEEKTGDGQRAAIKHVLTDSGRLELQHVRTARGE